jgi:hypothetical protein
LQLIRDRVGHLGQLSALNLGQAVQDIKLHLSHPLKGRGYEAAEVLDLICGLLGLVCHFGVASDGFD